MTTRINLALQFLGVFLRGDVKDVVQRDGLEIAHVAEYAKGGHESDVVQRRGDGLFRFIGFADVEDDIGAVDSRSSRKTSENNRFSTDKEIGSPSSCSINSLGGTAISSSPLRSPTLRTLGLNAGTMAICPLRIRNDIGPICCSP